MTQTKEILISQENKQITITLVIMGFLVFSPFGSILLMDMVGLPMSLPEFLFLPFVIIFRKKYHFSSITNIRSCIFFSIWILLIIISLLVDNYSLSAILSSSRSYLTLMLAFLVFSKKNNVDIDDVMYIALGSTLGWLYSSIYGIFIYIDGNADTISRTGNMIAIPLLIGIAVFRKHHKVLFFSIILCILISMTSGMRRQIFVFLMSISLSYVFLLIKKVNRFFQYSIMFILILGIFIIFLPQIKNFMQEKAPDLYYRIFLKTEMLLSGEKLQSGDTERLKMIENTAEKNSNFLFPRGFISKRTIEDKTGNYIDYPLSELLYMFGYVFTLLILLIISIHSFAGFYHYINAGSESIIFVMVALIMLMLLFLEGTFLGSSYVAPMTGYCIGRLVYYSKVSFTKGLRFNS